MGLREQRSGTSTRVAAILMAISLAAFPRPAAAEPSLVLTGLNRSPDYFCTWNVQGYVASYASGDAQRRAMVERNLFGHDKCQGWADFYPSVRDALFLVLDDSWDVPLNGDPRSFGSLVLNGERFPSFGGAPAERLRKLARVVRDRGWRGLGGWVCAQQAPAMAVADDAAYWTERLGWMREAGVGYWKVDWGGRARDATWRQTLTRLAARDAPNLYVEQALAEKTLASAAVYRTYDVENVIAAPVTIGRVAHLLRVAPASSPTVVNCEDEPYVAAGTGCAIGVMRHPFAGPLPNGRQDFAFPPVGRDLKRRLDEVVRAVNWHRLAAPLPLAAGGVAIDDRELADSWTLGPDETWTANHPGDRRDGKAPARVTRGGLPLPAVEVDAGQPVPFVLATRSPNGPVAVATVGRTLGRSYVTPRPRVTLDVGRTDTVGVFGTFGRLTLRFDPLPDRVRVLAQDLAGTQPIDVTDRVAIDGNAVTLDGQLLSTVGLAAAHAGDLSEPGLVIVVRAGG